MLAASAVFVVLVAACAPPPKTVAVIASPSPSPSPTPTAPLAATAPTFHVGEVGIAYGAVALAATGGVAPYKYTVQSGALPGGLAIGADGSISGTPTAGGDFPFTIAISDSGDSTTKVDGKISIAAALTAHLRPECASYCNVELGCTTACGNFGTLTGGVGPFAFSTVGGTVPAGTSVVGFSLSGTFTGQTGWVQFTVQASDSLGATTTIAPKFWMYPHISLAGGTCSYVQLPCTVKLSYSGGTPSGGASLAVGGWKPGQCYGTAPSPCPEPPISGSASSGTMTVTIGPVPPNSYPYPTGSYTVYLTNSDLCGSGQNCTSASVTLNLVWTG